MKPTMLTRMTLLVMIAVAAVGAVAAVLDDNWDHVVIFVVLAVLAAMLLARVSVTRPLVPIRADLVRWLNLRAGVTGDRPEHLADRAIAAYRDGLAGSGTGPGAHLRD